VRFGEHELGELERLCVAPPEVMHICEQTARPRDAAAIAQLLEGGDRGLQTALGLDMITRKE
jgi:hypothetical protein